jgi:hypothetical protein
LLPVYDLNEKADPAITAKAVIHLITGTKLAYKEAFLKKISANVSVGKIYKCLFDLKNMKIMG